LFIFSIHGAPLKMTGEGKSVCVNPQMETNSVQKQGLSIWEYLSLPAHFHTRIPHMEIGRVVLTCP
jgi:hypothetical protein